MVTEACAAAAQSLTEPKDPASGTVLRRWVERPEPFVRTATLRALRELRFADAFDPAPRTLADTSPDVRLEAIDDRDPDVRNAIRIALQQVRPRSIPVIEPALIVLTDVP